MAEPRAPRANAVRHARAPCSRPALRVHQGGIVAQLEHRGGAPLGGGLVGGPPPRGPRCLLDASSRRPPLGRRGATRASGRSSRPPRTARSFARLVCSAPGMVWMSDWSGGSSARGSTMGDFGETGRMSLSAGALGGGAERCGPSGGVLGGGVGARRAAVERGPAAGPGREPVGGRRAAHRAAGLGGERAALRGRRARSRLTRATSPSRSAMRSASRRRASASPSRCRWSAMSAICSSTSARLMSSGPIASSTSTIIPIASSSRPRVWSALPSLRLKTAHALAASGAPFSTSARAACSPSRSRDAAPSSSPRSARRRALSSTSRNAAKWGRPRTAW